MTTPAPLLPHFIIIGAMKSGTTTLYRYLSEHPDIDMSRDKETDFFVKEKAWPNGLAWYSNQFTAADRLRGEASPNYTKCRDFQGVPERMAQVCPTVKLIYIVRDPVKRVVSQFKHSYIQGTLRPQTLNQFYTTHEYAHILDASLYARQLKAFLQHYPKDAILVLDFDTLTENPQAVMDEITDHIGASRHPIVDQGAQNDSSQLSRVPAPILRFAQTPLGRNLASLVSRAARDRIRGALAFGQARTPPAFQEELLAQIRQDLAEDSAEFRQITGLSFPGWSL